MSTLIIKWDQERLIAVSGHPAGRCVVLQHVLSVARDPKASSEMLGEALRTVISNAGITCDTAIVVLPRSLVTLRRIQLPRVSDDELPAMVRLQAATRLTVPMDSVCMDFVPLPDQGEGRDVLLATAPVEQISDIRRTLQIAELHLSEVQISSFGIASALAHAGKLRTTDVSVEMVMILQPDLIELLLIRQSSVVFAHSGPSWSSSSQMEQVVRSEISRCRLAATEMNGPHTVHQITLVGNADVTSAVPSAITKGVDNATICRLDPADSIVQGKLPDNLTSSDVMAVAGMIARRQKNSVATIDLVNPRQPLEQPDRRRLKILLATSAVLLLSAAAWKWRDSSIADLQTMTQTINTEVSALKEDFQNGEEEFEQDVAIRQWAQGNIDWLGEMNRIREVMGGTDRLLIREFLFSAGHGSTRGTITAECYARERSDVQEFQRRLRAAGYDVVPRAIESGSHDPAYPTEFFLVLNIPVGEDKS